jgi:AcrR family transcriptional regulator
VTSGSRRGPYKRGIERRQQIVITATEVFGEHGYRGGTLQQVADRVGVTPAAIPKLFGSKENLLMAVLQYWTDVTSEIVAQGTIEYAHLDGLSRLMGYHVEHPGLLQLYTTMAAEASSPTHPVHDFMTTRYRTTLANMRSRFREASRAGYLRPLARTQIQHEAEYLLAIMDGLQIQFILNRRFNLEGSFSAYVDQTLARLGPVDLTRS